MVDDYYLMPNDIKLVNSNKNTATKFLSHHIGHLTTNNISVLSNKNKYDQLEVLENINFHNYKKTKSWTNNLANINEKAKPQQRDQQLKILVNDNCIKLKHKLCWNDNWKREVREMWETGQRELRDRAQTLREGLERGPKQRD